MKKELGSKLVDGKHRRVFPGLFYLFRILLLFFILNLDTVFVSQPVARFGKIHVIDFLDKLNDVPAFVTGSEAVP